MADITIDHFEETDEPRPWHRQRAQDEKGKTSFESTRSYSLFRAYLELREKRSYVKVALQAGVSRTYVERIAKRWRWTERTRAFDSHISDLETAAFITERKEMGKRIARGSILAQNIALAGMMALQEQLQQKGKLRGLTAYECARLYEVGTRIERAVRGDPDKDQVASIHVTIQRQTRPRYEEAGWTDDTKPKLDS
jgi:hypothetical protein